MPNLAPYRIGQPAYGEQLLKALELKGDLPADIVPDLAGVIVQDDFREHEFRWLRRIGRFHSGRVQTAVAGAYSSVNLVPASSNRILAVVEKIILSNPNAGQVTFVIGRQTPAVAIVGAPVAEPSMDDRQDPSAAGTATSAYSLVTNTNAVPIINPAGAVLFYDVPGNSTATLDNPGFVLTGKPVNAANFSIVAVMLNAVNTALRVSMVWRERELLTSEL